MIRLFNLYFPLSDFLYVLQLEEYMIGRYLRKSSSVLLKRNFQVRDKLRYTKRIQLTVLITLLILVASSLLITYMVGIVGLVVCVLLLPILLPYAIGIASAVISIPSRLIKNIRLKKAHTYFKATYPNTKIIAITGSFGKTTTKYLLQHVLQYDYKTSIIPDNINTGIGIANYILSKQVPIDTEYLIVEMAAYTRGDIAEAVAVLRPEISVLTVLGDQHMERFGSFENLVLGKAEIFTAFNTTCYTTDTAKEILKSHSVSTDNVIDVKDSGDAIALVRKLATDLNVSEKSIIESIASFKSPSRRNEIYTKDSVLIIDNSYNISPMIAEKMLKNAKEIARDVNKDLVVMTGGIGEQAPRNTQVNEAFGELLNEYANKVILNPTNFAPAIKSRLQVPCVYAANNRDVIDNVTDYVVASQEVLLWLTGQTDLEYI